MTAHVEKRALDRSHSAFVVHHEGGYAVTDGTRTNPARDLAEAKRVAYIHNQINGFFADVTELRVQP